MYLERIRHTLYTTTYREHPIDYVLRKLSHVVGGPDENGAPYLFKVLSGLMIPSLDQGSCNIYVSRKGVVATQEVIGDIRMRSFIMNHPIDDGQGFCSVLLPQHNYNSCVIFSRPLLIKLLVIQVLVDMGLDVSDTRVRLDFQTDVFERREYPT